MRWEGKDVDGDPWEVETNSNWEIVSHTLRGDGEIAIHSYTPTQARALIAALTEAVERVEARQKQEPEFDLLEELRALVKRAGGAR